MFAGCTQTPETPAPPTPQQMAASQRNRGPVKRSIEEIGRSAFGEGLKEAKSEKGVVSFVFVPKLDGEPIQNFNRMLAAALTAVPITFQQEKSAKAIRLTAIHEADANRKLLVYTVTREAGDKVDWAHGANPETIAKIAKMEHVDPEFRSFAAPAASQ